MSLKFSPQLCAFLLSSVVLCWLAGPSVGLRDSAELTAAAFTLDVPHPTGFAADMVLLRMAMLVPLGDLAFRANVATALCMATATALTAHITYALTDGVPSVVRTVCAGVPVVAMVASRTILRAGTSVEVYALALAVALAALSLLVVRTDASDAPRRRIAAWLLGATVGTHTASRPAALLSLLVLILVAPPPRCSIRRWVPLLVCLFAGSLLVLYLPVAAHRGGWIDWGDPRDLHGLLAHLSAARIRRAFAHRIMVPWRIPEDFSRVCSVLFEDLGATLILGTLGALLAVRHARARWISIAVLADVAYATLINPMGVTDRQTLFVAEAGLAMLSAWTLGRLVTLFVHRWERGRRCWSWLAIAAAVTVMIVSVVRFDGRHSARADGWSPTEILGGAGALGEVPPRALVLCESDDLCGHALYALLVEGERPDVLVLPRQHLHDASTWRRARTHVLGTQLPAIAPSDDLRVARLRALVEQLGPRIRWEPGEIDDERLAHVILGSSETPVLGAIGTHVGLVDRTAWQWLAVRTSDGVGARRLAAMVLFGAGRRVATVDLPGAVPLWEKAVALYPDHASSYTNLGVVRARMGDLPGAIRLTERALSIDPDRLTAWRNLATYRRALGDLEGSAAAQRALRRRQGR